MVNFTGILKSLGVLCVILFLSACSGSKPVTTPSTSETIPDMYLNPPADTDEYLFAVNVGESPVLRMATQAAEQNCRADLATKVSNQTDLLVEGFENQVTNNGGYDLKGKLRNVSKTVASESLVATQIVQRQVVEVEGIYKSYVLMKMPIGAIKEKFLGSLMQDEILRVDFENQQAIEDLKKEIAAYRQNRNQ